MEDENPLGPESLQPSQFQELRDLPSLIIHFARAPFATMKRPIRLSWPASLSFQAGAAILSGVLSGFFARNFWDFLTGLLVFPIISVGFGLLLARFLYQFFSVVQSTYLDFRRLHSIVVLATIPYFFLHTLSGWLPPIDLVGFATASIFLIVGLIEQFGLNRRTVITLISGVGIAFVIAWTLVRMMS